MMMQLTYPFNKLIDKYHGHSENSLISNWRSRGLLSGTSGDDEDKDIKKEEMKILKRNSSMDTLKSTERDRGVSKHWSEVLMRYHWPIAIGQCLFFVILIFYLSPWIILRFNDDGTTTIGIDKNDYSSLWQTLIGFIDTSKSSSPITTHNPSSCTYGYFCSNKKTQDGKPTRRKASFLKRKRYPKDIDY